MRTLLINPGESTGEGGSYGPMTSPHIGLAYLGSYLQERGEEVKIIEKPTYKMSNKDVLRVVQSYRPDVVGLTARSFNVKSAFQIAAGVKELSDSIQVVLGGSHAAALPEHTLEECSSIDATVRGYGEETLYEIIKRIREGYGDSKAYYEDVAGVTYRSGDSYTTNPERALIADLDSLPFPDYGMYDFKKFGKMYFPDSGRFEREFSIFASRGCPFLCTFCMAHGGEGISRARNMRSPENVIAEMEWNIEKFGAKTFTFNDSTWGINKKWVSDFCELLRRRGLHKRIRWAFETRADLGTEQLFSDVSAAGCTWIFAGFESGAETVLKGMKKGITKAHQRKYIANVRAAKIPYVSASFIVGLPYEDSKTIQETREMVEELSLDSVGVNVIQIYPGTDLFPMVDRGEGGINWVEGARMNWDIYDRTRPHTSVNDLGPNDLTQAANDLRSAALATQSKADRWRQVRKSISYFLYYSHADRPKLAHHIRQGVRDLAGGLKRRITPAS